MINVIGFIIENQLLKCLSSLVSLCGAGASIPHRAVGFGDEFSEPQLKFSIDAPLTR